MIAEGYRVYHKGELLPSSGEDHFITEGALEYVFMIDATHIYLMFHHPMSFEDALEYSKVNETDLILTDCDNLKQQQ